MNAKSIIQSICFFAAGAGTGYYLANRYLEKKWMDSAEVEIRESMKEFYKKQNQNGQEAQDIEDDVEILGTLTKAYISKKNEALKAAMDISGGAEEDDEDDDDTSEFGSEYPDEYSDPHNQTNTFVEPYVISFEEFADDGVIYEKETLCYFEDDDTLVDEGEDLIDNVSELIGLDALASFGEQSEDEDVVYIRNENMGTDYEIIRLHKSYQETVLGIQPEKPVAKKRPAKRSRPKTEEDN